MLVGGLAALYAYAGRVIGPKAVPAGRPAITRAQRAWFVAGLLLLWAAADWPVHDIGEEHLYFVHMVQHLALMLLVPPIMLMATPEWLARLVVGDGRVNAAMRRLARPVPAGALFAALTLVSHAPTVVNTAASNGLFHYGVHAVLVTSALLFWLPVCGPFPELRIGVPAQMIYLFVASLVPTVPGAWMIFADGAVYSTYDVPARLWGISVTSDQQVAGAIMKLLGGTYLWVIITALFFRWAGAQERRDRGVLTWQDVQEEFDEHPAPAAGA